jgi:hypothetical protein
MTLQYSPSCIANIFLLSSTICRSKSRSVDEAVRTLSPKEIFFYRRDICFSIVEADASLLSKQAHQSVVSMPVPVQYFQAAEATVAPEFI